MYLDAFIDGAMEKLVWLGPRNDWLETELLLLAAFFRIEGVDVTGTSEVLAIATFPRKQAPQKNHAWPKTAMDLFHKTEKAV